MEVEQCGEFKGLKTHQERVAFTHGWYAALDNAESRKPSTMRGGIMNYGWQCPKCGNCYSPIQFQCVRCNAAEIVESTQTAPNNARDEITPSGCIICCRANDCSFSFNDYKCRKLGGALRSPIA